MTRPFITEYSPTQASEKRDSTPTRDERHDNMLTRNEAESRFLTGAANLLDSPTPERIATFTRMAMGKLEEAPFGGYHPDEVEAVAARLYVSIRALNAADRAANGDWGSDREPFTAAPMPVWVDDEWDHELDLPVAAVIAYFRDRGLTGVPENMIRRIVKESPPAPHESLGQFTFFAAARVKRAMHDPRAKDFGRDPGWR